MATVTTLGFSIFSKFNGKGVVAAKKALADLAKQRPTVVVEARTEKALAEVRKVSAAIDKLKNKSASVTVSANTGAAHRNIRALQAEINKLKSKSASINVKIDGALANITRVKAALATLHDKTITIHVNTDTEQVRILAQLLRRVGDEGENTGRRMSTSFTGMNGSVNRVVKSFDAFQGSQMAMLRLALLLGPAVVGGLGAAGVAALQTVTAFTAAAGGAGVFALALKNVAAITNSQVRVQIDRAKTAFKSFGTGSAALLGQVMVHAVNAFINVLHLIEPAVRPVTKVFLAIAKEIEGFTKSPGAQAFMGWFKVMAPIAITSLWGTFKVLANGMYHFLARIGAFNGQVFLDWLNRTAHAFNTWANGEGPVKLKRFFDQWGPVLIQAAKGLLQLAFAMGKALNPVVIILIGWLGRFSGWLAKLIEQHPILGQVIAGVILGYRLLAMTVAIVASVQSVLATRVVRSTAAWVANRLALVGIWIQLRLIALWEAITSTRLYQTTAALFRNTAAWIANKAQVVASKAAAAGGWLLGIISALGRQTAALFRNTGAWIANRIQVVLSRAAAAGGWMASMVGAIGRQTAALFRNTLAWIANRAQVLASRLVAAGGWLLGVIGALGRQTAALVRNTLAWIAYRVQVAAARAVSIAGAVIATAMAVGRQTGALIANTAAWIANIGRIIVARAVQIGIAAATRAWAIAQLLLNVAMRANPFILIVSLLIALGLALVAAYKKSETFRNIVNAAFRIVAGAAMFLWDKIKIAFNFIRSHIGVVFNWIKHNWPLVAGILLFPFIGPIGIIIALCWKFRGTIMSVFGTIKNFIVSAWGTVWRWAVGVFNKILAGLKIFWNWVKRNWPLLAGILLFPFIGPIGIIIALVIKFRRQIADAFGRIRAYIQSHWGGAWAFVRNVFNRAWGAIRGTLGVMRNWIAGAFNAIGHAVGRAWSAMWSFVRRIFSGAWGAIRGTLNVMRRWIGAAFNAIGHAVGRAWQAMWSFVRRAFSGAWGAIRGTFNVMRSWIASAFNWIGHRVGGAWQAMWRFVRRMFSASWGAIRGTLSVMKSWIKAAFDWIGHRVGSAWQAMWKFVRRIFSASWGAIRGTLTVMKNWIHSAFNAIGHAVGRAWQAMWSFVRKTFNGAWGALRGSMRVMEKTMAGIWHAIVNTTGKIFNGIKKAVGRPINTVIGFVQTLAKLADKALSLVGVKSNIFGAIKGWKVSGYNQGGIVGVDKPTMGFAMGGLMPGYSPGRDNLVAPSPIGPVGLSGGEGILRPEVMRAPGMKEFLYTANRKARSGGIHGVKNLVGNRGPSNGDKTFDTFHVAEKFRNPNGGGPGFANGGVVANFDDGGIFGGVFNGIKKAFNAASAFVPGLGSLGAIFKGGKKIFETTGFDLIVDKVLGKAMDKAITGTSKLGPFGGIAAGIGRKIIDAITNYVVGKTTPMTADGDLIYKNPSKRLKRGLAWAKTQDGKPYQWGGGGNPSWDCSGFMAGIQRVIMGQSPGRLYTTHDFRGKSAPKGWKQDAASPFMVGVMGGNPGHMAGTLLGTHVESAGGGKGVHVGPRARGAFDKIFKSHYGFMPVAKDATLVGGGFGSGGPMSGTIGKSGEAFVGTFWDTGHSGYGDTGAPASGKKMHKFALASRNLIPYGKTAIMQAFGQKRMAAFESIDYGPGITSRLFDIDTYGAAWLFGKEKQWSSSNPGKDVSPGVFRVHWKKGYGRGGNIPGGQLSLVGERGAEVMMPNNGQKVFKSGSTVSVGDTHIHFHDKVYAKSEKEFEQMVVTAISEAERKKKKRRR